MIKSHESLNYLEEIIWKQKKVIESRLKKIADFHFVCYLEYRNELSLCLLSKNNELAQDVAVFRFENGEWICFDNPHKLPDDIIQKLIAEITAWDNDGSAL